LWPLFTIFTPIERRLACRNEMIRSGSPHAVLGVMSSRVPYPRWLRFCPECLRLARQKCDEGGYWDRLAQIPGVDGCPLHALRLIDSRVPYRRMTNRYAFVTAESSLGDVFMHDRFVTDAELTLARNCQWILDNPKVHFGQDAIKDRLRSALVQAGYALYSGKLCTSKLRDDMRKHFGTGFLSSTGCDIPSSGTSWIETLFHGRLRVQHPLRYLMIMQFLAIAPKDILAPDQRSQFPFGAGPWPCLNQATDHFRHLTITDCQVSNSWDSHKLTGRFACGRCGMVYTRFGPDRANDDLFKRRYIPIYGPIWDKRLSSLWSESSVSLREISRVLGVDIWTIRRQARRLELPGREYAERPRRVPSVKKESPDIDQRIRLGKVEWDRLRELRPTAGRKQLCSIRPDLAAFLRRYAPIWLKKNLPERLERQPAKERVDWSRRDAELARRVGVAADEVRERTPLRQLTKTAILNQAGISIPKTQTMNKLPRTLSELSRHAESGLEFGLRKLKRVNRDAVQGGERLAPWKLIRRAAIRTEMASDPAFRSALEQIANERTPN
jgi:Tn7-like transposition protein D